MFVTLIRLDQFPKKVSATEQPTRKRDPRFDSLARRLARGRCGTPETARNREFNTGLTLTAGSAIRAIPFCLVSQRHLSTLVKANGVFHLQRKNRGVDPKKAQHYNSAPVLWMAQCRSPRTSGKEFLLQRSWFRRRNPKLLTEADFRTQVVDNREVTLRPRQGGPLALRNEPYNRRLWTRDRSATVPLRR